MRTASGAGPGGPWLCWASVILAASASAQGLDGLVVQAERLGARTGVLVAEAGGGTLYARRAGEAFAPASNLKILTAAAVLSGLSPAYEFETRFELRAGKLVVRAGGDPNWISGTAHAPEILFGRLVQALRRAGVERLRGIELDPGPFTGPARPAGWPADQLDTWYCAPTGGLVLEEGCVAVRIEAGSGRYARVRIVAPPVERPFANRLLLTSDRRKGSRYGVRDTGGALRLGGSFYRRSPPVRIRAAVRDPESWYLDALRQALAGAGIAVDPSAPGAADPADPADPAVLVVRTPLRPAIERILRHSSNFAAEQCLRVLGAEKLGDGSLAGGLRAMLAELRALAGHPPPAAVLTDGSGLSRDNRVTPAYLVAVLQEILRRPEGDELLAALPRPGKDGSLRSRFRDSPVAGRVLAKTGWIAGASALTGVLRTREGGLRLFSILMNYDPRIQGLNKDLKRIQERMVEAMDRMAAGG